MTERIATWILVLVLVLIAGIVAFFWQLWNLGSS